MPRRQSSRPHPRALVPATVFVRRSPRSARLCSARRRTCSITSVRLRGAALLAGATGTLLFGALGFLLAIPLLRRLRRRHDSWAAPAAVLALMAVVFAFSTFVIGPALTGANDEPAPKSSPSAPAPGQSQPDDPGRPTPDEHESHH